jgi:predicted metal-dependent hydrolase
VADEIILTKASRGKTVPPNNNNNNGDFNQGLNLFNRARFFDAHEVLEDVWRSVPRDQPLRRHLQGMVQLAVAFHHESKGNHVGARSVLERALRNLNGGDNSFPHIDLERLRADLAPWRQYLDDSTSALHARVDAQEVSAPKAPALPKIRLRR